MNTLNEFKKKQSKEIEIICDLLNFLEMKWFIIHLPEPKPIPLNFWFEVWKCLEFTYKLILQNKELLSREDYVRNFVAYNLRFQRVLTLFQVRFLRIRSLVYMPILMVLNMKKQKFH